MNIRTGMAGLLCLVGTLFCTGKGEAVESDSFWYAKLGGSTVEEAGKTEPGAIISVGRRTRWDYVGLDIASDLMMDHGGSYQVALPRISFMGYLTPNRNHSLYGGLGAAYGFAKNQGSHETGDLGDFSGGMVNGLVGYEVKTSTKTRTFAEVGVTQPVIALAGPAASKMKPRFSLGVGLGF